MLELTREVAECLLRDGGGDLIHHALHHAGNAYDFLQRRTGFHGFRDAAFHQHRAGLHRFHGLKRFFLNFFDFVRDFRGGVRGAFGEFADFVRHHGEPAALVAGASRFDGGVQGEQVGLVGDIVDDAGDFADLLGAFAQFLDAARGFLGGFRRSVRFP